MKLILLLFLYAAGSEYLLDDFPLEARSPAMGGVIAAPSDPVFAPATTPAALPASDWLAFSSLHARLPFGDNIFALSGGTDVLGRFGVRMNWIQVAGRNIEQTRIDSISSADTLAYSTVGYIETDEYVASLLIGARFLDQIRAGCSIKYLRNRIGQYTGAGWGADAGLSWTSVSGVAGFGLVVRNIFSFAVDYGALGKEEQVPSIRVGASYRMLEQKWGFYADIKRVATVSGSEAVFIGTEYRPLPVVAVRAGLGEISVHSTGGLSLGAGIALEGVQVDYAFTGYSEEGLAGTHRVGIGYRIRLYV
ncbi:MAG: hypothetical protein A2487_00055 [Candidatus Raymondbacteria bacterium RifOxyC12_full_50_8]|uniref:Autotransporter domain-containing protein n=1 Tax=Candidatus Raymondbacteria bacterium RIFOXYD12_FULL_49_13 TaxID=1817890 RepID=A0A1F7FLY7_UNCRA|nr:MAG: hypothetical protein A2248_15760 [Candidatus Raymondbacteria bacterium RIFOXYA2_FULL_49_16]OGJ96073.1 MAG: hypothetical protein A2453_08300 [Candidatus Raymondbacteria bacterium RIFOXYC2_FULL_50_21]OGJ99579.1 MAG: hypothetical protein A2487_00055 [Candidatus Raymondbacteria bacterium RifOxyC12_full_50_8]OGK07633.1 MAG: hypothetical protein A2519_21970 [Candidatus Raymondbacteria bacterium RIFOXYD12_FULL_49_13]OGP40470.1 MAG: hypothetical protein A2324_00165 [Candidatus Raymondbacteria b